MYSCNCNKWRLCAFHLYFDTCWGWDWPSEFVRCFEAVETQLLSYFDVLFCVLSLSLSPSPSSLSFSLSLTQGVLQELYPSVPRGSLRQRETLVPSSLMTCLESCPWECVCECVCLCMPPVYECVQAYVSEMYCTETAQWEWRLCKFHSLTLRWLPLSTFTFYLSFSEKPLWCGRLEEVIQALQCATVKTS